MGWFDHGHRIFLPSFFCLTPGHRVMNAWPLGVVVQTFLVPRYCLKELKDTTSLECELLGCGSAAPVELKWRIQGPLNSASSHALAKRQVRSTVRSEMLNISAISRFSNPAKKRSLTISALKGS
jgi:hypothetical protein